MTARHRWWIAASIALSCACASPPAPPAAAVALAPCTDVAAEPADCGTLTVFENRGTRQGRQIPINFLVLRSAAGPSRDAVFLFAGGPGQGSTSMLDIANGWLRPVRATLDVVLVDQRGTGKSHPLTCEPVADRDPALAFGHIFDPDLVRRCRDRLAASADLAQYTTAVAVEDIDDVRQALGYERISLYGVSYGSRLAQAYARRFPDRTRSIVLDGVVPFDAPLPVTYAAGAQRALDLVLDACVTRPPCRAAHPAPAREFAALLAKLDTGTVPASITAREGPRVPVRMSRGDFGYAVRGVLYSPRALNELPDLIGRAASTGDVSEFAQRYWDRAARLERSLALGHHLSVLCAEDAAFVDDAAARKAVAGTFLGSYVLDEYRQACGLWSVPRIADAGRAPLRTAAPTLLISGRFDPVTPPDFADAVARSLTNARHIVAPGGAHGSGPGCPREAVLHVLTTGGLDGVPAVCQ
jgi:pimeloyl-ACP methyl ester carboxylesterase